MVQIFIDYQAQTVPAVSPIYELCEIMNTHKLTAFTWILIALALTLVIGIPWANKYIPYTNTFGHFVDVWNVNPKHDPHYQYRYTIIVFGFLVTGLSMLCLIISLFYKKESLDSRLLNLLIFIFIVAIGFKNYPYWSNGLIYVYGNGSNTTAYDPKAILPEIEFGKWWSDWVFYVYLISFVAIPFYLVRPIIKWRKNAQPLILNKLTLTFAVLLLLSFFTTPNFVYWLAD